MCLPWKVYVVLVAVVLVTVYLVVSRIKTEVKSAATATESQLRGFLDLGNPCGGLKGADACDAKKECTW